MKQKNQHRKKSCQNDKKLQLQAATTSMRKLRISAKTSQIAVPVAPDLSLGLIDTSEGELMTKCAEFQAIFSKTKRNKRCIVMAKKILHRQLSRDARDQWADVAKLWRTFRTNAILHCGMTRQNWSPKPDRIELPAHNCAEKWLCVQDLVGSDEQQFNRRKEGR